MSGGGIGGCSAGFSHCTWTTCSLLYIAAQPKVLRLRQNDDALEHSNAGSSVALLSFTCSSCNILLRPVMVSLDEIREMFRCSWRREKEKTRPPVAALRTYPFSFLKHVRLSPLRELAAPCARLICNIGLPVFGFGLV